ncbi:ABC transporter ATP-binding protein [Fluviibacterium sp. DFM31]|uniref:ABC transporter ATP-binding protein n=1 Tax=Meridianimarinicoccus marinus TaxID=3231483 RepID=A0ABV3L9L8_9RHOB
MTELHIRNLSKRYGEVEVLKDINLHVNTGEFTVFVGPSGCGKSTLLRMICGLDEVSGGEIAIDGELVNAVPPSKRGIAMVFQSYALYPHMTVAENMGYALRLAGETKELINQRVARASEILKIDSYLDRKPRQLSGGQRQRVAIGRAIVREPKIFLFDEPLSNLDAALRVDMRMEFARLKDRLGTTMIYVTHDQVEAMTLADKIVVMRAGRIEQIGSPLDLYRAPDNRFVAGFIGSPKMNFLPVIGQSGDRLSVPGGSVAAPMSGTPTEIGVRPEHMEITEAGANTLTGTVMASEHLGSDTFAYVSIAGVERPILVRLHGEYAINPGAAVSVGFEDRSLHYFDAEGLSIARAEVPAAA